MSSIETGGPAFPVQDASKWQAHGLTLRDYFAAKAMQSAMVACDLLAGKPNEFAEIAYQMADAMLEARK